MQGEEGAADVFCKNADRRISDKQTPKLKERVRRSQPCRFVCLVREAGPIRLASVGVALYSVAGSFVPVRSVFLRTLKPQPLEEAGPDLP